MHGTAADAAQTIHGQLPSRHCQQKNEAMEAIGKGVGGSWGMCITTGVTGTGSSAGPGPHVQNRAEYVANGV